MPALMDTTPGKCATCDNDRTGAHPQCKECQNKRTVDEATSYPHYVAISHTTYHKPVWVRSQYTHKERLATACGVDSATTVLTTFPNEQRYIFNKKPCRRCFR